MKVTITKKQKLIALTKYLLILIFSLFLLKVLPYIYSLLYGYDGIDIFRKVVVVFVVVIAIFALNRYKKYFM